jgi:hypothetical protein
VLDQEARHPLLWLEVGPDDGCGPRALERTSVGVPLSYGVEVWGTLYHFIDNDPTFVSSRLRNTVHKPYFHIHLIS